MATNWLSTITSLFSASDDRLGDSIVKVNAAVNRTLTPAQKKALKERSRVIIAQIEALVVELVDSIPFVPRSVATIAVALLVNAIDGAIATALEKSKAS